MDLMSRHSLMLTSARFVVLDEADEMLDLGFLEDVEMILSRCPSGRQTALFSATMPTEIKNLAEKGMYDPVTIKVRAATLTIVTGSYMPFSARFLISVGIVALKSAVWRPDGQRLRIIS